MMTRRRFLVALGAAGSFGAATMLWLSHKKRLPELADVCPVTLQPCDTLPFTIPGRYKAVIELAVPCHRLSYSEVVHALRLWGPDVRWDRQGCFGGRTLLAIVLDESAWATFFPGRTPFVRSGAGWCHRVAKPGWEGDSHAGYSLSALAELNIPANYPIRAGGQLGTILDLLRGGLWEFSWQGELEWWATAFARYLSPTFRWRNKDGDIITLSQIGDFLVQRPLGTGECYGTHALLALVTLLRVDGMRPFLATAPRAKLEDCIRFASERLITSQHVTGLWGTDWHTGHRFEGPEDANASLTVTGHSLEWLAWCPAALRPPAPVLARAMEALVNLMLEHGTGRYGRLDYASFTHAARALRLWHGEVPALPTDVDQGITRTR
jgi:hypothetical protein